MKRALELILSNCLADVMERGLSPEEALSKYQEHREELEPLLYTALRVTSLPKDIRPSANFRAATRELLAREAAVQRGSASGIASFFGYRANRWATVSAKAASIAATLLLSLTLGGAGSVYASIDTVPGDPLYAVKVAAERTRLALAFSEDEKTSLYLTMAENRLGELSRIADRDPKAVEALADEYKRTVIQARTEAKKSESAGAMRMVEQRVSNHSDVLQEVYQAVPQSAQRAVALALQVSQQADDKTSYVPAQGTATGPVAAVAAVALVDNATTGPVAAVAAVALVDNATAPEAASMPQNTQEPVNNPNGNATSVPVLDTKGSGPPQSAEPVKGISGQPAPSTQPATKDGATAATGPIAVTAKEDSAAAPTTATGTQDAATQPANTSTQPGSSTAIEPKSDTPPAAGTGTAEPQAKPTPSSGAASKDNTISSR